jgi:hypothetical protein
MTESAPMIGINPSGGGGPERWDIDGLGARKFLRSRRMSMSSGKRTGALGSGRDDLAEGERSGNCAEGKCSGNCADGGRGGSWDSVDGGFDVSGGVMACIGSVDA